MKICGGAFFFGGRKIIVFGKIMSGCAEKTLVIGFSGVFCLSHQVLGVLRCGKVSFKGFNVEIEEIGMSLGITT